MITPNSKAKSILHKIYYAALATASADGQPWNSPVYFVHDENYNLYWASATQSQHSQNIYANDKVFMVVYDSTVPWGKGRGIYVQATAAEVRDPQLITAVCQLRKAHAPEAAQPLEAFMGNSPRRIYCAKPQKIWMNSNGQKDGQYIDIRVKAEEQ